jgi:hypothetical protein
VPSVAPETTLRLIPTEIDTRVVAPLDNVVDLKSPAHGALSATARLLETTKALTEATSGGSVVDAHVVPLLVSTLPDVLGAIA